MATIQQQSAWYQHPVFRSFASSDYITVFTDWFMTLAGKATELVLYATVLYSCAQLYPGVNLPDRLNLAVFLIQMGALDIGGLSLVKLARQAKRDNNNEGAAQAERLSYVLIAIMLISVVTVGLGHIISFPDWVQTAIQIVLVVARSICSVLYGRVIHLLKKDHAMITTPVQIPAIQETKKTEIHIVKRKIHLKKDAHSALKFADLCAQMADEIEPQIAPEMPLISEPNLDEIKPDFTSNLAPISNNDNALQAKPRSKYYMTFEEASAYTGYSISALKSQVKSREILASANGQKLKVSSLKLKPQTSRKTADTNEHPRLSVVR